MTTSVVESLLTQLQIILQVIESNCMVLLNWLEGVAYNSGRLDTRYALHSLITAQHKKLFQWLWNRIGRAQHASTG